MTRLKKRLRIKKVGEDDDQIKYTYVNNTTKKITNPFPDVISDDEIEKAFKNKESWRR